jgi:uncharacterized DUF497 family protein
MYQARFEWDDAKDLANQLKHGLSFSMAQFTFFDHRRVIARDTQHGGPEIRYYCFGRVEQGIATVRFTWRDGVIRIFGAGYWRKGKPIYERQNQVQR